MKDTTHAEFPGADGLPDGFSEARERAREGTPSFAEDRASLEAQFSPANPWFSGGQRAAAWAAGDRARIAAFAPEPGLIGGRRATFFGFFEAAAGEDGAAAAAELLTEAAAWSRARGAEVMYGPVNFNTYGDYRLKLSSEPGALPFLGEPHNPARYPALLESHGAILDQSYLTQVFSSADIRAKRERKAYVRDGLCDQGFTFAPLTPAVWMARLRELHGLADSIFGDNFGYTPLPWPLFERACGQSYIGRADPDASVICFDPAGDVAGLFLVYPHYGGLLAGGGRVAASEISFAAHASGALAAAPHPTAVMKTVGVRHDLRRRGVMDALVLEVFERGDERYDRWFGALIRADNPSRNFADGSHPLERRYGLYRLDL